MSRDQPVREFASARGCWRRWLLTPAPYSPLYRDQRLCNTLSDVIHRVNRKHRAHTIYFAGMWGAAETAPARISFTVIPRIDEFEL